ncbi:inactive ubiquitin carboxyl-terminal hydrolase MINDY-4B-like [Daphnia carinata]|uniref:inactive ubiquitin carboxyl-terminal hydrolase MINDY-4B-like n=1 Tax=Daphnia carinata TaxID=120202 RepID=UPI0025795EA8|nr:inactive ubiquitin carboxyl-terminal hydrolase MINDY-4B-like [Daphnia carinata]
MNFKGYDFEFATRSGPGGVFTFPATRLAGRGATESRERPTRSLSLVLPANNQGKPITEDVAVALRKLVLGQCPAVVRCEFFTQGPGLIFREHGHPLAYALAITNPSTTPMLRALVMTIQAQILRTLLFDSAILKLPKTCNPLMPTTVTIQQEALACAIANIIWKAGNGQSAILCLPQANVVHVVGSPQFNEDGLTEKLQLCPMSRIEDLHQTVRRNIHVFQEDPGPALMLILYSAILTRGVEQVTEDLGKPTGGDGILTPVKCLLNINGSISFSPISLFVLGRASPFLHNGVQYQEDGQGCTTEETGVLIRSSIGLLVWMGNEAKTSTYNVGSRLKTPTVPIWIVIASEQSGVLFGEDKVILRDHQAENRFQLYYHTSTFHQQNPMILKINNRSRDDSIIDAPVPTLEKLIRTKWGDARIDWGGVEPFV